MGSLSLVISFTWNLLLFISHLHPSFVIPFFTILHSCSSCSFSLIISSLSSSLRIIVTVLQLLPESFNRSTNVIIFLVKVHHQSSVDQSYYNISNSSLVTITER